MSEQDAVIALAMLGASALGSVVGIGVGYMLIRLSAWVRYFSR